MIVICPFCDGETRVVGLATRPVHRIPETGFFCRGSLTSALPQLLGRPHRIWNHTHVTVA